MATDANVNVRREFGHAEKHGRMYLGALFDAGRKVVGSSRGDAENVWHTEVKAAADRAREAGIVPFQVPQSAGAISKFRTIARFFLVEAGMTGVALAQYAKDVNGWTAFYEAAVYAKKNAISAEEILVALRDGDGSAFQGEKSKKDKDPLDVAYATYKAKGGDRNALLAYLLANMPS